MTERKRTEIDWQDVRAFLALGRYRSLSAAARALQVNHATVARRLQSLEASLGEKLVDRRPDGYVLTTAGEAALRGAADMEAAAHTLKRSREAAPGEVRGQVRLNAPPALAQGFLLARLAEISALHPGLDIDLATDMRSISLERHKADIAIRVGKPIDADLIAKPLGRMAFGFYGVPALCDAVERGRAPSFIGFDEGNVGIPESVWLTQQFPRARIAFRAENHVLQAIAARAGVGLALVPHYLGRQLADLRSCTLKPQPPTRDIWLLIRRQDRAASAIRTVMTHLVDAFKAAEAQFAA